MSRHRKITTNEVLDAAERVVVRLGAAGLSIDAVAKEAGISKSRVVYDHKSKSGLLEALIDRKIDAERKKLDAAVAASAGTPHPALYGQIANSENPPSEADKAVAIAISAAMSNEEKLQQKMRDWISGDLHSAIGGTERPQAALLAFLALSGFGCLEVLDLYRWSDDERTRILDGIRTIFTSYPEPQEYNRTDL